jgi:hypothetical protein
VPEQHIFRLIVLPLNRNSFELDLVEFGLGWENGKIKKIEWLSR